MRLRPLLLWLSLVPASLANLLWVAVVLKLPLPAPVQWILMLGGNLLILFVAATLLGRAAKRDGATARAREGQVHPDAGA